MPPFVSLPSNEGNQQEKQPRPVQSYKEEHENKFQTYYVHKEFENSLSTYKEVAKSYQFTI
jgi:hypothetical protein